MREQRWESRQRLSFTQVLDLLNRLQAKGLSPVDPEKEGICYVEEWPVSSPEAIQQLDQWVLEDVTMVQVLDEWTGDFFLLAGRRHSIFQRYQSVGTYCSISHPWRLSGHAATLHPLAMFWIGFRHTHSFIRIRLHTSEVIAPGEPHASHQGPVWVEERRTAFCEAIDLLDLPIEVSIQQGRVTLHNAHKEVPFFCSWPDAFGPCQFELNSSDPFAFLVPASALASTHQLPTATVRVYLTGFSQEALNEFTTTEPRTRTVYRCSAHVRLTDLPDLLEIVGKGGRLYTTVSEFRTQSVLPDYPDAAAIVGIIGTTHHYQLEVRFNRMPLPMSEMDRWLEDLLTFPMTYAPLSPFP